MSTVKINVNYLADTALDWAVGVALGHDMSKAVNYGAYIRIPCSANPPHTVMFCPTTNWHQAGPIIEKECIEISCIHTTGWTPDTWTARHPQRHIVNGPTPLIAAMRCYVASKLGDIVEVPRELYKEEN
jgi:hypothetical protein